MEDAYEVQEMQIQHMLENGEKIIGWKFGATSRAVMEQLEIKKPFLGCMTTRSEFSFSGFDLIHEGIVMHRNGHLQASACGVEALGDPLKEMLDYFAAEHCNGCRMEQCKLFKNCGVRPCHQEMGVDFCYQCDQLPCNRTNFDESLYQGWVAINEIIRKKGIDTYCEKARARPRYA